MRKNLLNEDRQDGIEYQGYAYTLKSFSQILQVVFPFRVEEIAAD